MQQILIVPGAPVVDGLIADLVSLLGYEPVVPPRFEALASSVERVQPAVVMIDADHGGSGDPAVILAAQHVGAGVILYSGSLSAGELQALAHSEGVGYFSLPNGPKALAAAIAEARSVVEEDGSDSEGRRVARWTRLAGHHQSRVRRHESLVRHGVTDFQSATAKWHVNAKAGDAAHRSREAGRSAREQLRTEVTRYVLQLKSLDVPKAELLSRVGGVVRRALEASLSARDASDLEAQVAEWCVAAYSGVA